MPRKGPPPGYISAGAANKVLGGMLYKHVDAGRITPYKPGTRKYGFYKEEEVRKLAEMDKAFFGTEKGKDIGAIFSLATLEDMDGVSELARYLLDSKITADQRREWMRREPRGHYVVKRKDNTVVAYLYLQPLIHDRLIAYMNKEIRGWNIAEDDIDSFEPGKPVEVMIGGIGSLSDVKNAKEEEIGMNYAAVLLRGVFKDIVRLGREGVTMSKLYAYSETRDGIAWCTYLGMNRYAPPIGKRCTFQLDLEHDEVFNPYLLAYLEALIEWRKSHPEQYQRAKELWT
jgi:hypothetical protein